MSDQVVNKEYNSAAQDHATTNGGNTTVPHQRYDYGGNPLAHINTGDSARLPAFGGDLQPGLYRPANPRKFANPAPLGLCGFALTTFVLGLINVQADGLTVPSIVIGPAFAYGGLVQLLAGMWEMAVGNTFGATALASYGGFWISFAIILTPGGFNIEDAYSGTDDFTYALGIFLYGWFIFTTILLLCTLRSTVAFFLLFFFLDMAFLLLASGYVTGADGTTTNVPVVKAGGYFAILAAVMAWYNALAGIADSGNSFFLIPVAHFPWSEKGRERRGISNKSEREIV